MLIEIILFSLQYCLNSANIQLLYPSRISIWYLPLVRLTICLLKYQIYSRPVSLSIYLFRVGLIIQLGKKPDSVIQLAKWQAPQIITNGKIHQPFTLIYLIAIAYLQFLGCIDLAFPCQLKRVTTRVKVIWPIIKPVSSKLQRSLFIIPYLAIILQSS